MGFMQSNFDPEKHKRYIPKFQGKFVGNVPPVARSSWELAFMRWCDYNSSVVKWSSETIQIPYFDPVSQKHRRYYPDFNMVVKDNTGRETPYIVEIKPYKEIHPPKKSSGKMVKTMMYESQMYARNVSKWNAAQDFCKKRGIIFRLLTEKELF